MGKEKDDSMKQHEIKRNAALGMLNKGLKTMMDMGAFLLNPNSHIYSSVDPNLMLLSKLSEYKSYMPTQELIRVLSVIQG